MTITQTSEDENLHQFIRICILNDMATDICYFVQTQGAENLMDALDLNCGAIPPGNYEQVVDQHAPQEFLKLYTGIAENRFAFAVTNALKFNPNFLTAIKNYCQEKGAAIKIEKIDSAKSAFQAIQTFWLDGMPESKSKKIISADEKNVSWENAMDNHKKYWEKVGGDINVYYELQKCFVHGLLAQSNISFSISENKFFSISVN